jgi:mannose/cellobiose epimerase-like protein (N-acyl-D-glucosamine 2-epimerase family)
MQPKPTHDEKAAQGTDFLDRPIHRLWLLEQARDLLDFFLPSSINPGGGFFTLNRMGAPVNPPAAGGQVRKLHSTTRMVHCAVIAHQLGLPGADDVIDHGMDFIWARHRDRKSGGYFWAVDDREAVDPAKQAYGHAFVLLAGASAKVAGHPNADRLLADVTETLLGRFWDPEFGATSEEYMSDWTPLSTYRGQNSNMHLSEALMAAFEATGENSYMDMAGSIADLIVNRHARAECWRVAEHFNDEWHVDRDYAGDPMFRPCGVTPGHALEWARLLVQLWELGGRACSWMLLAAQSLFLTACETGWDRDKGGFYYTLDWNNQPDQTDRFWWPCCEGIAAASVLQKVSDDPRFEQWYCRIWSFANRYLIDRKNGGWFAELDNGLCPVEKVFEGKPDLYHALQACLIPLIPSDGSITRHLAFARYDDLLSGGVKRLS